MSSLPAEAARRAAVIPKTSRGFTLLELMAVMAILGSVLLILPPRIDGFGDRTKLESAGSTMVAVMTGAREQAVIDGHEVILQYEMGDPRDRHATGRYRWVVAKTTHETPKELDKSGTQKTADSESEADEEWVETPWRGLPAGVVITGYSQERGQWIKSTPKGEPISVSFLADGSVRPAHALRLESIDLPANVPHVLTVRINALTSAADVVFGEEELPAKRDASDFR